MKGSELRAIRKALGMSRQEFALYIGYTGSPKNNDDRVRQYEHDRRQIPLYLARFAWLLEQVHLCRGAGPVERFTTGTKDATVLWPYWPGYEFESTPDPPTTKRGNDERDDFY